MRLEELHFVTSNPGKLREAESVLGCRLAHCDLELEELQSLDLEQVVRHKAAEAFRRLSVPVLVEDTSLELAGLGGFPGPLVRWLLASVGPAGICRLAGAFGNRLAAVRCVALASDGAAEAVGAGVVTGTIVESPRGGNGFGWDSAFAPDGGGGRTYAEMDEAEKNAISHRRKAFEALRAALSAGGSGG
ncbi:MAG TPA: non-canonical purine NTP pyrophosphatase [Thermoanaerobaculales bacterium]|nr:non-canonical purine NTP pyrophosphatase [Thermoanaerobaculales bacterium]HQN96904.1 non-canonical purine NTP pyrophosphatase [Thermoanaerobaculales bacterium]HQP44939.1 non-canonical purine NTP pyrophosphatase [Thermoanaerobaculales bacterium]